jgi:hypothetical protein
MPSASLGCFVKASYASDTDELFRGDLWIVGIFVGMIFHGQLL